jgi:homoaconitate hydratase
MRTFSRPTAAALRTASARPVRRLATHAALPASAAGVPQTFIEKVIQSHAVDLRRGQRVLAGDYLAIRPAQVMTHDNTGPCISK